MPSLIQAYRSSIGMVFFRIALVGLFCFAVSTSNGQPVIASAEYKLKGVFLYNFLQFTEWPASSFDEHDSPLVIGVVGEDPFGPYLDSLVARETINNRAITVERYPDIQSIGKCHLLFISKKYERYETRILQRLKGQSTLTVGETENFAEQGGMIRLYIHENKIRMQINVEAVRTGSLVLSSKLLRLAAICC